MKALALYLVGLVVVFGLLAVIITASRSTARAFVVVDSSFPMRAVWSQVPGALDEIEQGDFAEFAVATEKSLVHGWQDSLRFRSGTPFAPCDWSAIEAYDEVAQADQLIVITTASSCPTDGLTGAWDVVSLRP